MSETHFREGSSYSYKCIKFMKKLKLYTLLCIVMHHAYHALVKELYRSEVFFFESQRNFMLETSLYRITKALGSGQFGVVSMGVWQSPMGAVEVAVKQLQPGATEAEKIRFLQEAAINGQFRHPNVVQLMGVVTTGEPVSLILYRITAAGVLFQCMACCENNCRI